MHNYPGLPVGEFAIRPGPDDGGGRPHLHRDRRPRRARGGRTSRSTRCWWARRSSTRSSRSSRATSIRCSRRWSRSAMFQAGSADNVIPQTALLSRHRAQPRPRCAILLEGALARGGGGHGEALWRQGQADLQARLSGHAQPRAADGVRGLGRRRSRWRRARRRQCRAGDGRGGFLVHAEARPGAFIFVGNGDSAGLHHPAYNFNDEVIPVGTSYWVKLVETALRV